MPVADDPYNALITEVEPAARGGRASTLPSARFNGSWRRRGAPRPARSQLAGQSDERVLAAGLAWEHATA